MKALVIDRRLQSCSNEELRSHVQRLLDYWIEKGYPDWGDMPKQMLGEWVRLSDEVQRRGIQLSLFSGGE